MGNNRVSFANELEKGDNYKQREQGENPPADDHVKKAQEATHRAKLAAAVALGQMRNKQLKFALPRKNIDGEQINSQEYAEKLVEKAINEINNTEKNASSTAENHHYDKYDLWNPFSFFLNITTSDPKTPPKPETTSWEIFDFLTKNISKEYSKNSDEDSFDSIFKKFTVEMKKERENQTERFDTTQKTDITKILTKEQEEMAEPRPNPQELTQNFNPSSVKTDINHSKIRSIFQSYKRIL